MQNYNPQKSEQSDKFNSSLNLRIRRQSKTLNNTQRLSAKNKEEGFSSGKDKAFPIC